MSKENYNLITDLNPGSIIRVTYTDAEVEQLNGSIDNEPVTRDYMIINPGPVIQQAEPDKIFVVDIEDGMLSAFADKDIEVYTVKKK